MADKEKIPCYRCGNPYYKDDLKLFGYLCDSCFADVKELIPSDGVTPRGTQVCKFEDGDGIIYWALYNPTNGDEIREIALHLQRNLVPVNAWAIETPQGISYLLVVGNRGDEIVPSTMKHIDPQVPTHKIKQIVITETDHQIALGRTLSTFILGKPCENKLELTIHEVGEISIHAADLIKAKLPPVDIIEKMLTKFYVSDPITRKAAFIGSLCNSSIEDIAKKTNRELDVLEFIEERQPVTCSELANKFGEGGYTLSPIEGCVVAYGMSEDLVEAIHWINSKWRDWNHSLPQQDLRQIQALHPDSN